jgi:hypothetical protein
MSDHDNPAMMKPQPRKEHEWLHKLVGEWRYETDTTSMQGVPAAILTGTESVRSVGGIWVVTEGQGQMPGGNQAEWLITLGFDVQKERFVGSWAGSMMAILWVYDGELNAEETTLILDSEGPHLTEEGKTGNYRDVIEFIDDDHRTLTAYWQGDDGGWQELMKTHYYRK